MKSKKKGIFCLLCAGVIVVVLCVIVVKCHQRADNHTTSKVECSTPYLNRDDEAIKDHLASYPNDAEALEKLNILVVYPGFAHGREFWDAFVEKTKKGEKCSIDIVTFGTEGSIGITYLEYNGTNYYRLVDLTRDSGSGYYSQTYTYLNCLEIPEDEYENVDFSDMKGKILAIFLSNKKFGSYKEYVRYFNSSSYKEGDASLSFTLWPLTRENFREVLHITE